MELQKYFSKFLFRSPKKTFTPQETALSSAMVQITGTGIINIEIYKEAFSLKSPADRSGKNYERLEFLGDSILGSVISCYLFENYPHANEGLLTQLKAKIVNRKSLNKLGEDLQLVDFIQNGKSCILGENIYGNLFEALVGAIYLDLGYDVCRRVILEKLLPPSEMTKLENKIMSYKGLLLEWAQKKKLPLKYDTTEEHLPNKVLVFRSVVWLGDQKVANASESSKKKAEEKAAQRAFYILNKKENILEKPKTFS